MKNRFEDNARLADTVNTIIPSADATGVTFETLTADENATLAKLVNDDFFVACGSYTGARSLITNYSAVTNTPFADLVIASKLKLIYLYTVHHGMSKMADEAVVAKDYETVRMRVLETKACIKNDIFKDCGTLDDACNLIMSNPAVANVPFDELTQPSKAKYAQLLSVQCGKELSEVKVRCHYEYAREESLKRLRTEDEEHVDVPAESVETSASVPETHEYPDVASAGGEPSVESESSGSVGDEQSATTKPEGQPVIKEAPIAKPATQSAKVKAEKIEPKTKQDKATSKPAVAPSAKPVTPKPVASSKPVAYPVANKPKDKLAEPKTKEQSKVNNRFGKCNDMPSLQCVLGKNGIPLNELNPDEKADLVAKFNKYTGSDVKMPLSSADYNKICKEIQKRVAVIAAEEMYEKNKTVKGFVEKINLIVDTCKEAGKGAKVKVGEDTDSYFGRVDESLNTCKDAISGVFGVVSNMLGLEELKQSVNWTLYYRLNGAKTKRDFFAAAEAARQCVYDKIKDILAWGDPTEHDLKTVAALRYVVGEDENGNKVYERRSIFDAFCNSVSLLCQKATRVLKRWFGTDAKTNIFGSVGAAFSSFFGAVANVAGSVLKVALHTIIYVGSYIVTAFLKIVACVWDKLKAAYHFIKSKFTKEDAEAAETEEADEE